MKALAATVAVVLGAALLVPAGAAARTFQGQIYLQPNGVADLSLKVVYRDGEPYSFRRIRSGVIPLTCEQGASKFRFNTTLRRRLPYPTIRSTGRFRLAIFDVETAARATISGVIRDDFARGGRITFTRPHPTKGRCETEGQPSWFAARR